MNNAHTNAFEFIGPLTPQGEVRMRDRSPARIDRGTRVAITAFLTALPALAAFVMWLADPQGTAAFQATRTGQTLFYAGFIWVGIGMLEVRRTVFSRTVRRLPSSAR